MNESSRSGRLARDAHASSRSWATRRGRDDPPRLMASPRPGTPSSWRLLPRCPEVGCPGSERNTGGISIVATFEKRKARAPPPGLGAGEAMDSRRAIVEEEPVASHHPNRCRKVDHHRAVRRNHKVDLTARPNEPNDAGLIGAVRGEGRPDISLLAGRHSEKEPHEDRDLNNRPCPCGRPQRLLGIAAQRRAQSLNGTRLVITSRGSLGDLVDSASTYRANAAGS